MTTKEKVKIIRELYDNKTFTAYEVGKNTNLDATGIQKIVDGKTKRPREETLNKILQYLEEKMQKNLIEEPPFDYQRNKGFTKTEELKEIMTINFDILAKAVEKIYTNTEIIKSNTNNISHSMDQLAKTINYNK